MKITKTDDLTDVYNLPKIKKPKIKTQKSTSAIQTLKKLIGGSAGVIDKIIDSFGATDDLRVLFYIEFLKQRKTPYGVKDIPNGKQKFAKFAAKFYEPVLNGDLNTTNPHYISALKKFLKTGKFVFNKEVVLHLEDYFKTPVTGYYGLRGIGYKERERGGKSSLAARFSSNIMMELTNSLGRYTLVYNNGVATINDRYDFDDVNDFYNTFKRKGGKEYNLKTLKRSIIGTIKDKFGDSDKKISLKSIKKANLNRFLYKLMFDVNEMIHTDGYQGYEISFKFPMTVDKSRLIANIKRLEDALATEKATKEAAKVTDMAIDVAKAKEYQRQLALKAKSPVRRKPYKPTKCINSKTCFEYGAKCIDLTELKIHGLLDKFSQDFINSDQFRLFREEGEFSDINYFGAFIALGLMKPKEALEAQQFVPSICLPIEMLDGDGLKDDLHRTEKSVRQIFALYKQTIKGVLEEAQYKEIKEIFKRYL
jgi:hypothetical protein